MVVYFDDISAYRWCLEITRLIFNLPLKSCGERSYMATCRSLALPLTKLFSWAKLYRLRESLWSKTILKQLWNSNSLYTCITSDELSLLSGVIFFYLRSSAILVVLRVIFQIASSKWLLNGLNKRMRVSSCSKKVLPKLLSLCCPISIRLLNLIVMHREWKLVES